MSVQGSVGLRPRRAIEFGGADANSTSPAEAVLEKLKQDGGSGQVVRRTFTFTRSTSPKEQRRPTSATQTRRHPPSAKPILPAQPISSSQPSARRAQSPREQRRAVAVSPRLIRRTASPVQQTSPQRSARKYDPEHIERLYRLAKATMEKRHRGPEVNMVPVPEISERSRGLAHDRFPSLEQPVDLPQGRGKSSYQNYGALLYQESMKLKEIRDRERRALQQFIEQKKAEQMLEDVTFKPAINARSAHLVSSILPDKVSVFERLAKSKPLNYSAPVAPPPPGTVRNMRPGSPRRVGSTAPARSPERSQLSSVEVSPKVNVEKSPQPPQAEVHAPAATSQRSSLANIARPFPDSTPTEEASLSPPSTPLSPPSAGPKSRVPSATMEPIRVPEPPPPPPPPPPLPKVTQFEIIGDAVEGLRLLARGEFQHCSAADCEVRWLRQTPDGDGSFLRIPEANSVEYVITLDDVGCVLRCECMPSGGDADKVAAAHTERVQPAHPSIHDLRITGTLVQSGTLVAAGRYVGGYPAHPIVRWQRSLDGVTFEHIHGADQRELQLSPDDTPALIRVVYIPVRADGVKGTAATCTTSDRIAVDAPTSAEVKRVIDSTGSFPVQIGGETRTLELLKDRLKIRKGKKTVGKATYVDLGAMPGALVLSKDGIQLQIGKQTLLINPSSRSQRDIIVLTLRAKFGQLKGVRLQK